MQAPTPEKKTCPICRGKGRMQAGQYLGEICPYCKGTGVRPCEACNGAGRRTFRDEIAPNVFRIRYEPCLVCQPKQVNSLRHYR
jgi:DnaJ-class molecular chaperone